MSRSIATEQSISTEPSVDDLTTRLFHAAVTTRTLDPCAASARIETLLREILDRTEYAPASACSASDGPVHDYWCVYIPALGATRRRILEIAAQDERFKLERTL